MSSISLVITSDSCIALKKRRLNLTTRHNFTIYVGFADYELIKISRTRTFANG